MARTKGMVSEMRKRFGSIITVVLAAFMLSVLIAPAEARQSGSNKVYKTGLRIYGTHLVGAPQQQALRYKGLVPSGHKAADIKLPANCAPTDRVSDSGQPIVSCRITIKSRSRFRLRSAKAQRRSGSWVKIKTQSTRASLVFDAVKGETYPFKDVRVQSRVKPGAKPFKVQTFGANPGNEEKGCPVNEIFSSFPMRCDNPPGGAGSSCETGTAYQVLRAPDKTLYGDRDQIVVQPGGGSREIPLSWKVGSDKLVMCDVTVIVYKRLEPYGYVEARRYKLETGKSGGSGTATYNFPEEEFVYVTFKARKKQ